MSRRLALMMLPWAFSTAALAACTLDFDHFAPGADAGLSGDALDDTSLSDSPATDGATADADAGGPSCPVSGCMQQATSCGATCGQQAQDCTGNCGTQRCMQNCTSTEQSCLGRCASTCIACEQDGGCALSRACLDAAHP